MSYLGRSAKLSLKAQEKVSFLATAGQTVKTGLSYTPSFVEVYVNGVLLTDTTDFTATNGNSITFTVALLLNDEVTVISLKTFTVADHYSKTEADTLLAAKSPVDSPSFTGNVLVGQTSVNIANNGHSFGANGNYAHHTSTESTTLILNRKTSNGDIVRLRKDNAAVGSIGTLGGATYFGSAESGIMFNGVNQNPTNGTSTRVDNTNDLGASSYRYKDIYLGGGAFLGGTATANKLDDYEEGTFTPAWATTSGAQPTVGYSNRFGHYVKVGRLVTLRFEMYMNALTVNGATSSVLILNNLPFALANPAASVGSNTTAYFSWARARSELTGYGFNEIGFLGTVDRTGNAQAWNWETISALRSNSEFRATFQYETNS